MANTLINAAHPSIVHEAKDYLTVLRWEVTTNVNATAVNLRVPFENASCQAYGLDADGALQYPSAYACTITRSLDGATYDTTALLTLGNADGAGTFKEVNNKAFQYLILNCSSLTLGSAAKLVVICYCWRNR